MACQQVRDIRERQKSGIIQIRVLRKWISKGKKEELCYQFCDVHGDCIEATADVKHIEHFNSMIQLQSCYRTKQEIEITLWPDKLHLIGDDVIPGDIVAITSVKVTEHNGFLQLESTNLTTAVKNPDMPQAVDHVQSYAGDCKKRADCHPSRPGDDWPTEGSGSSRNFTCEATITRINDNRAWYYVLCSKCSNKLYQVQDNGNIVFVCKDDDNIVPNFRYCVNATIADATAIAEAVFFNESINTILNINCEDMVTKYGQPTNPNKVPEILKSITNTPRLLHLTLKNDGQIAVNNVTNLVESSDVQSTGTVSGTSTIIPLTPIPVPNISKRQLLQTPDAGPEKKQRRA
ncbi:hypothetical protein CASFOL_028071 [Castilleja foliolosa]|uniref:Replication factor A C-terminal domain-containing protein n=1 Tax=Castilleja foliolosa TaxID=1961234 RepID=A0ABD3CF69_9LAMI